MAFTKVVGAGIHTLSNITSHNVHSSGIITATKFDGPFDNINVSGAATFTGNVTIGGTLTYEDVTNIDSVGLVTAREGIFIPDNKKAHFGNAAGSGDLQIYHDTSNGSYLREAGPGAFRIQGDAGIWIQSASSNQDRIVTNHNGDVQLFYSGNKKLNTTNTGVEVTGILTATNGLDAIGIQSGGVNISTGILTAINFIGAGNTFKVDGTTVDVSISGNTGAGGTWSSYTAGIATTKSIGINTNNLDDNDLVGVGNSFQGMYISNGMMIMDNTLNGNHYIGTAFNGLMAGPVTIDGTLTIDGNYVVV
tara:strand:+ start:2161 stop:3078 length:918 start_codon:yes stop_codon:yes gene_type:complete